MVDDIANLTLRSLRRILRAADLGSRQVTSETGLTPSQLLVLREIERRADATPSLVAAALQFSQATITNLVDRLEAAGFVLRQRSERDKRQILLRATAAGQSLLASAPDILQERFRDRFASLEAWEQAMILAGLERLAVVLGAEGIDAAPLIDAGAIDRRPPG
jgi:DNA-binding MarR family transcriptional regulator